MSALAGGRQLVFIDSNVQDIQELLAGLAPGVEAFVLDASSDGVQQIANILAANDLSDLSSISIVGHGAAGQIQLGSTVLDAGDLSSDSAALAKIGASLAPGGDLQIYGCDLAQGATGSAFLQQLSQVTGGSNIAASSNPVGAAAEGGSWNLNVDVGAPDVASPFTAAAASAYPDTLGAASDLVWYISDASTVDNTGVYTVDVSGDAAATNPTDVESTPSADFVSLQGLAIDPADGHYFVSNFLRSGPYGETNQIIEGNTNGGGTPSVIYTSGYNGGDAIEGLAFDPSNGLLYFAVTDANIPDANTDTGIYTINALGSGVQTATDLVDLSSGVQAPTDIAIDATNNLLFYTDGVPGLSNVEEVGVANLTTGKIIDDDLVSYSASGVEPYGIAVNPATDTVYWTTVNFSADSGNAVYSATYSTGASVTLSNQQTLATTSQGQTPIGIALDVPAGGYYIDTSTGISNDTTPNEVLFGSSLTAPAALTVVYDVPNTDGGAETLPTAAIVVEDQPTVTASGTVTYVEGHAAIAIDAGATVADASGYDLAGATVSIASGLGSDDTLNFTNQNNITGSYSSGTLTLTGVATAADYQSALDSVTFSTTSSTDTTPRTLDWTVSDGVSTNATTQTSMIDVAPCFVRGTSIQTVRGEVAVEDLRVDDLAVARSDGLRPIVWLGHRALDCRRHRDPRAVWPVRVAAGAFGEGRPSRDLWLSPGHSVAVDGVLIPIRHLLNGHSIVQVETAAVEYWHVELDQHDILLAQGLPAESYLDCGNRNGFVNGGAFIEAHPDFEPKDWRETCLPLVERGPEVARAKARLLARLFDAGHEVTRGADAHVLADGRRIEPIWLSQTRLAFALPKGCASLVLKSHTFVPAHTRAESFDERELGLCVARLQIDGDDVALEDAALSMRGWHGRETDDEGRFQRRWTRGEALLPAGARLALVDLAGYGYYWREPAATCSGNLACSV